jgi:hypothetical protein
VGVEARDGIGAPVHDAALIDGAMQGGENSSKVVLIGLSY